MSVLLIMMNTIVDDDNARASSINNTHYIILEPRRCIIIIKCRFIQSFPLVLLYSLNRSFLLLSSFPYFSIQPIARQQSFARYVYYMMLYMKYSIYVRGGYNQFDT